MISPEREVQIHEAYLFVKGSREGIDRAIINRIIYESYCELKIRFQKVLIAEGYKPGRGSYKLFDGWSFIEFGKGRVYAEVLENEVRVTTANIATSSAKSHFLLTESNLEECLKWTREKVSNMREKNKKVVI
jgi:hypothetical protein